VDDGKTGPLDAVAVVVTLTFQPGAIPTGIGLRYHGGDTWEAKAATPEAGGLPTTVTFRLPVGDSLPDSPYARQTLWEFGLYLNHPTPARAWEGTLHVEAKAVRT
jgi:hypothetical protein